MEAGIRITTDKGKCVSSQIFEHSFIDAALPYCYSFFHVSDDSSSKLYKTKFKHI
jgi:hypothetical protein